MMCSFQALSSTVAFLLLAFAQATGHCATRQAVAPSLLQVSQQQSRAGPHGQGTTGLLTGGAVVHDVKTRLGVALQEPLLIATGMVENNHAPDASFFDSFAEGESTFDADGEFLAAGNEEDLSTPDLRGLGLPTVEPTAWYHETESAGPKEAWQTYGPNSKDIHPYSDAPAWEEKSTGRVVQDWYTDNPDEFTTDALFPAVAHGKDAAWFDIGVDQYDGFGRPRSPSDLSDKYYVEWAELKRTVNLTCVDPGCIAKQSLQVFDNSSKEEYKLCRVTIMLHATDFDDEYSRETVEWLTINDKEVLRNFTPMAKGCGNPPPGTSFLETGRAQTASGKGTDYSGHSSATPSGGDSPEAGPPLYPCLTDLSVQEMLGNEGKLKIEGKISKYVDECPVNGNHFSAVAVVTCYHRPIPAPPTTTPAPIEVKKATQEFRTNISKAFSCKAPGCTSNVLLMVDDFNKEKRNCKLTVRINNTDFDENGGVTEGIEWLQVNGKNETLGQITGKKNPCQEAAIKAANVSDDTSAIHTVLFHDSFTLLDEKDVTSELEGGNLTLSVKISDMVDECGIDGYLLVGFAEIVCD